MTFLCYQSGILQANFTSLIVEDTRSNPGYRSPLSWVHCSSLSQGTAVIYLTLPSPFLLPDLKKFLQPRRTEDNRHHWQDVTVGSLVGLLFSFFAYRQYFPPLGAQDCHAAYPPRFLRGSPSMSLAAINGRNGAGTGAEEQSGRTGEERELVYTDELRGGHARGGSMESADGGTHV